MQYLLFICYIIKFTYMTFNFGLNYITYLEDECFECDVYSFQLEDKLTCEVFNFDLEKIDCSQKLITFIINIPSEQSCKSEYKGRLICGEDVVYNYNVIILCNEC